jgi:glutamine cyclotransferase
MLTIKHISLIFLLSISLIACQRDEHKNEVKRDAITANDFIQIDWSSMLNQKDIPIYGYKIIHQYPHDVNSFTQGLKIDNDNNMYESAGLYKKSKLKQVDLQSGKLIREHILSPSYFAEGMTILNDRIYQLTYQDNLGFIYDKNSFKELGTFKYAGQGWGLTNDGKHLIMSDGSSSLTFLDPTTFAVDHILIVHHKNQNIGSLNEIEYINGEIYANIFMSNIIAIISPQDGEVKGWINLNNLNPVPDDKTGELVLNGITYSKKDNVLLVTGKGWPYVYAIQLIPGTS